MSDLINLFIDDVPLQAKPGAMIIEVADEADIYIPRFCYHKHLSIAANCRMCLVEVENVGKPLPACATPVSPDMKVYTTSKKALSAQRSVMQFLLMNHPLDCPICDQGGQCELQDVAMGYGSAHSHYESTKRAVFSEDIGPLIETEMTRCIHCTRCVRFGEEVAGLRELGVVHRGEHAEIGTYVKQLVRSELSGNVIDLCPVGALTEKPSRYSSRAWEVTEHPMIAPHDGVGSHIYVHSRGEEYSPHRRVMRVVPREAAEINASWISDRDRFSYEGLTHPERAVEPMIRSGNEWRVVDWRRALLEVADRTRAITTEQGAQAVAALLHPSSTLEEGFLLKQWCDALGTPHLDHRLRQTAFEPATDYCDAQGLGLPIHEIEKSDALLIVGSDIHHEQPLIAHRVRTAVKNGAVVSAVHLKVPEFALPVKEQWVGYDLPRHLAEIVKAVAVRKQRTLDALSGVEVSEEANAVADRLVSAKKPILMFGADALSHPELPQLRALAALLHELANVHIAFLNPGANAQGLWASACVPGESGSSAKALLSEKPVRAYFLMGFEPEYDCADAERALKALKQAGLVVCITSFVTAAMKEYADFILPMATFTETAGSFINLAGQCQSFVAVSPPLGESKPGWKIIRALANFMELPGFDFETAVSVREAWEQSTKGVAPVSLQSCRLRALSQAPGHLVRYAPLPLYRLDPLTRRARALRLAIPEAVIKGVVVHPETAAALKLTEGATVQVKQGDTLLQATLYCDDKLAKDVVFLPQGTQISAGVGAAYGSVALEAVA